MYDMLIVGAGPAGISAALTAQHRGRGVLVIGNDFRESPLAKAHVIHNYPGITGDGMQLLEAMHQQLRALDIPVVTRRVLQAMASGGGFSCSAGTDVYEARSLLLCTGLPRGRELEGEHMYLGRGVSNCATCDGMLYRGRDTVVAGEGGEAVEDANFLHGIGCRVQFFARGERPGGLREEIPFHSAKRFRVVGENGRATGLEADGTFYPAYAVFVLRPTVSIESLLHGLKTEDGRIVTDRDMTTSIPGVFAAGDCAGKPLQLAKAVGEGNIAALSADRWLIEKGGKND